MDINRAREIINSPNDIEVKYQGKSVWINSINPTIGNAFIETRDGNRKHYQVPVTELTEE
ncbi:MAG: Small acid-soluble spore protein family [Candidatus Petromonas sp.]|jgi:small acid-soluble spore protein H (minor)|nr:Small acid-soluble spore protein family [Candidatus Petromonas sp.]